jgi:hypothetical protein
MSRVGFAFDVLHTLFGDVSTSLVKIRGDSVGCVPFGGVVDQKGEMVTDIQDDVIWPDGSQQTRSAHSHEMKAHESGEKLCK